MSCFKPIKAYRIEDQTKLSFAPSVKQRSKIVETIEIPCGKCLGCTLDHANEWATRCWCEAIGWKNNCFITLTYDNEHIPENEMLRKRDIQLFMKRLRQEFSGIENWEVPCGKNKGKIEQPIRYLICGEYGGKTHRPHYHMCCFNWKPKDLKFYKENHSGDRLFTSKTLNKIWGNGFVIIGDLTYQSACYVSRYVTKKLFKNVDKSAKNDIKDIKEFILMSRNGGIGIKYWNDYQDKIIKNEGILIKIKDKVKNKKIPKYFMRKWEESGDNNYDWYKYEQYKKGNEAWKEILSKTSLNESEYRLQLYEQLIEKAKILRRDNII